MPWSSFPLPSLSILAWLFHHLFGLFFLHAACHADPSLAAGCPCGGAGHSQCCLGSQGGAGAPQDHQPEPRLGNAVPCTQLPAPRPWLSPGFPTDDSHLQRELCCSIFSYCISCSIKAICSSFCIQSLHSSHLLHFC